MYIVKLNLSTEQFSHKMPSPWSV